LIVVIHLDISSLFFFWLWIQGDRIHAVTRFRDLERWKSLLEDNKTYVLHNCLVFDNDAAFKHVDHPFKVVFGSGSKVTRNDKLTDIPCHEFKFKSFKEIEDGNFKPDVLYGMDMIFYCLNFFVFCFLAMKLLMMVIYFFKKSLA